MTKTLKHCLLNALTEEPKALPVNSFNMKGTGNVLTYVSKVIR
jgi:hypothetical protein